jgi:hypothetical protein
MESLRQLIWLGESAGVPLCTVYPRTMFAVYAKKYRILARVAVIFYTKNTGYFPWAFTVMGVGRVGEETSLLILLNCDSAV